MNAPTIWQCLNEPSSACVTSPHVLMPLVLLLALMFAGALSARRNPFSHARIVRFGLRTGLTLMALAVLAISAFVAFDRETVFRHDTDPVMQTVFVMVFALFGAGVALTLGVLAASLGGALHGRSRTSQAGSTVSAARATSPGVIAIDGPAASGKGTLAKRIAQHFGVPCLDTGLLYRAVARDVLAKAARLDDEAAAVAAARALDAATLADPALRGPAAGDAASVVAKVPAVRAALLDYQRAFARQPGGAVLDGRDIGTVVCPDAEIKLFVTATAEERARRRHLEHQARGESISYDQVLADIRARDARDSGRDIAPMAAAADAVTIDTTTLNADAAFAAALKMISDRRG